MRRFSFFLFICILFSSFAPAQESSKLSDSKFAIKVEPFHGAYTSHSYHFEKFRPFSPKGVNLGLEPLVRWMLSDMTMVMTNKKGVPKNVD